MRTVQQTQKTTIDLKKLRAGHNDEFCKIYANYLNKIYKYALKRLQNEQDAEEITQEVFCILWKHRHNIYSQNLIWKVVTNKCNDYLRKRLRNRVQNFDEVFDYSYRQKIDEILIFEEQKQQLYQKLSSGQRDVLALLIQGLDRKQIANKLTIPIGTVDSRIYRTKKTIGEYLS